MIKKAVLNLEFMHAVVRILNPEKQKAQIPAETEGTRPTDAGNNMI